MYNRMVIELVQNSPCHGYTIYIRSGLTITNDLNEHIQLGLEFIPSEHLFPTSNDQSVSINQKLTNHVDQNIILLDVIGPHQTYPIPINWSSLISIRMATLCFRMLNMMESIEELPIYDWAYLVYDSQIPNAQLMNEADEFAEEHSIKADFEHLWQVATKYIELDRCKQPGKNNYF